MLFDGVTSVFGSLGMAKCVLPLYFTPLAPTPTTVMCKIIDHISNSTHSAFAVSYFAYRNITNGLCMSSDRMLCSADT